MTFSYPILTYAAITWLLCFPAGYVFDFANKTSTLVYIDTATNITTSFPFEVQVCSTIVFVALIMLAFLMTCHCQMINRHVLMPNTRRKIIYTSTRQ